jgi:flagellar basal-body rod modification protein FlgD
MSTTDGVTGVTSTGSTTSSNSTANAVTNATQTLGQADFLQLLVTELQNQDPLDPVDNKDFIADMAQFSSLEQMQNMNTNFQSLLTQQSLSQLNFAVNLVSHNIVGTDASGNQVTGVVSNIDYSAGNTSVMVNNTSVPLSNIIKIY